MTSSARTLDLDITGIAHGGTFIARHEGRVVFVPDAIPGERVRAEVTEGDEGKRFWRAETLEVIEASPHRRDHVWAEADISRSPADRVGGADLGHIALEHQRMLKQRVLQEALDKFAGPGVDAPSVEPVDQGDGTGWRTRVSLHVDADGRVGPYAARSHRVIDVATLPLARPAVEAAAFGLRSQKPGRVDIVEPADGRARVLPRPEGARRGRPEVVFEQVGGRRFQLDAGGFWQVHPRAAETLHDAVGQALAGRVDPDATHFDLYGGVGLFASTLAEQGATDIVTVESDRRATEHASANLADVDVHAVTARVDRFLTGIPDGTRAGAVVLDPPRAGAGRGVVESIHALDPETVVYVACDPVALARDLGTFRELGWDIASLRAFDLFPHSHHFEAVALLSR
ncbi:class I SAM-dependent RNA methyltransferase [Microbacterium esteraromaticum]|uniref:class I SAM-dependent RNA methyltransferase n=1 Tax=Microbacterium esteraromaticum TaxID=57043 RepID=UPI00195B38B8|nr:TRAM domain-containing protein [Microbacterium esteraromaticum]MBM7465032.1 tRNA/tmRNA/rRNA uracil-C5-methylase (TrmA/RlmC/RlmD family) [Microbacterium esteraromaticum]